MLLEFGILNLSVLIVLLLRTPHLFYKPFLELVINDLIPLFSIFNVAWGLIVLNIGDPNYYIRNSFRKKLNYALLNTFIFIGLVSTMAIFFKVTYFNRTIILSPIFLFSIFSLIIFTGLTKNKKFKINQQSKSRILLVGATREFKTVIDFAEKIQPLGYSTVGFLNNDNNYPLLANENVDFLGKVNDLPRVLENKNVDEIFVSGLSMQETELQGIIKVADSHGIRVNLIPERPMLQGSNLTTSDLDGYPIFKHRETPLDNFNNFLLKRIFDTAFSLSVLLLASPFLLLIALLIKLDSRGPIFYKPLRKGEANGTFKCYKFRTMSICDDPINGNKSTIKDDPRITRIGKYLRKYDLDEFPQFYNVLKGEMSVVGPRPHRINLQNDFRKIVNDYMVRHYVRPGITGWAQVNGWRGPTTTAKQKKTRIKYDLWYIKNWSFLLDIKIVFLTVFSKKTRENAF